MTPAICVLDFEASRRRDVSAIRSVITAVLIIFPPNAAHKSTRDSQWFPITSQPDGRGEAHPGEYQPDPQTRAAQEPSRCELFQRNKMRIDRDAILVRQIEGSLGESKQAGLQHGSQKRSVEGNVLHGGNRKPRHHGPEKYRAPRPA